MDIFIFGLAAFIGLLLIGCVGSSNRVDSALVTTSMVIMLFGLLQIMVTT